MNNYIPDIHTLLIVHFLVYLVNCFAAYLLWRKFKTSFEGLAWFFADQCTQVIGVFMLAFLTAGLPKLLLLTLPHLILLSGPYLILRCLEQFTAQRISHLIYKVMILLAVVLFPLLDMLYPNTMAVYTLMGVFIAVFDIPLVWFIIKKTPSYLKRESRFLAAIIALFALLGILRALLLFGVVPGFSPLYIEFIIILLFTGLSIIKISAMFFLVTQKLRYDVTNAESRAKEREVYFKAIFENAPVGIFHSNWNGNLLSCNLALSRMLEYESPAAFMSAVSNIGTQVYVDPQKRSEILKSFRENSGWVHYDAVQWMCRTGRIITVDMVGRKVCDSLGNDLYLEGFITDISEIISNQRTLQEYRNNLEHLVEERGNQIRQSEKLVMLGTLATGVAHEINNPAHFISLGLPLVKQTWLAAEPYLQQVNSSVRVGAVPFAEMAQNVIPTIDTMIDGVNRLEKIVGELREYASPDRSGLTMKIDLSEVIRSSLRLIRPLLKQKEEQSITVDLPDAPVIVRGSAHQMGQVILNLLQNANKALTREEKKIALSVTCSEGLAVITIEDSGVGIDPSIKGQLTNPFFTTRQNTGGLGLGLSIVSRIVAEHKGTLTFSDRPAGGTMVRVSIPLEGM